MLNKLKVVILWVALIVGVIFALKYLERWWTLQELQLLAQGRPLLFSGIYAAILILIGAFCLPGSGPLTVIAGAVFGLWWGVVLVSFASAIGATVAMLATRAWLQDWVKLRFKDLTEKVTRGMERDGLWYLFSIRMIPVVPFFLVNLAFGLTLMPAWRFYLVTQMGMLAGVFVYVNAGTQLQNLDSSGWSAIMEAPVLISFLLLASFPWLVKFILQRLKPLSLHNTHGN